MEIGTVKQVEIQTEMEEAYLDYAMSVIVSRALPDVRDGLKPVHRRILYAMHDMGLTHDKAYKKSARIVGEVLGKYHPHGDAPVYDAMVRMAQDFSLRYVLVDGQGNFGSIDGDNPAAMRYTEARLQQLALEMLGDIDKDTIDFVSNFDGTLQEPAVLPAALPNLLVNGSSGIAVGMATNIPPHNLGEVCDALVHLIDHYQHVEDVTVEQLMAFVRGPDFPTGGIIYRYDGNGAFQGEDVIARAYASGRGHFRVQARAHIEEMSRNRNRIVVTELPYQVNKTRLIERIAELARDEKIEGITDLRDESDRTGMRIVIELTRNVDPKDVLAQLYKYTPMQQTFGMSMLALVDGEPRMLSLRRILQLFIEHRREVIRRRSVFELERARQRAHILEGLLKALDMLDEVIQAIRRSQTTDTARNNLIRRFGFTEIQAQAILDMPLKRLAALERKRLQEEYQGLLERIAYLEDLLAHPAKVLGVIREDLLALKERYGDGRRTRIVAAGASRDSLTVRDLIDEEPVLIGLTADGFLLRESMVGRRRGKLPSKIGDQAPGQIVAGTTHDELFLFAADGRMARVPVHRLPSDTPVHVADLGVFSRNDRLVAMSSLTRSMADSELCWVLATREGRVKRVTFTDAWAALGVTTAMKVEAGDELVGVVTGDGSAEIMLVTKLGQSIRFPEAEVRPMGLPAAGVWGMKLGSGDELVALGVTQPEGELVVATTGGYFKRTPLKEFSIQRRHGSGLTAIRLGQRSGAVSDACVATAADEFFSASRRGTLRRVDSQEIPRGGRSTLGKMLVQPAKNDAVVTLLTLPSRRASSAGRAGSSRGGASPAEIEDEPQPAKQAAARSPAKPRTRRSSSTGPSRPARRTTAAGSNAEAKPAPAKTRSRSTSSTGSSRSTQRITAAESKAEAKPAPAKTRSRGSSPAAAPGTEEKQPAAKPKPRPGSSSSQRAGAPEEKARSTSAAKRPKQLSLLDKLRSVDDSD